MNPGRITTTSPPGQAGGEFYYFRLCLFYCYVQPEKHKTDWWQDLLHWHATEARGGYRGRCRGFRRTMKDKDMNLLPIADYVYRGGASYQGQGSIDTFHEGLG